MNYKKHYPTDAARRTACRHLLAVLRRAPSRRARWHRQSHRRRPWLVRPLTVGEQTLLRWRCLTQELAGLLEPFRRTRLRGHDELYGLLCDADTRPAVLAQVNALSACLDRLHPEQRQMGQQIERWRQQWQHATPAAKDQLKQVDKALLLNAYHNGLGLLLEEAQRDISTIKVLCPLAFEPPPPAAWHGNVSPPNQTAPPPYS